MTRSSKKKRTASKAKSTLRKKSKTKNPVRVSKKTREIKLDKALTDNFIALQKIMVNFSTKFDNLSNQISKLLELFEISAKSLARKDLEEGKENKDTKTILEKLDNISKQAGLIGKGLALIHEISSEKEPYIMSAEPGPSIPQRKSAPEIQGYQKSIASKDSEAKPFGSMTKETPK